jgi:hypothetical protein
MVWRRRDPQHRRRHIGMAEVIQFAKRTETQTLHFEEKHAFGEIGGLMLSLVQEQDKATRPTRSCCSAGTTCSSRWSRLSQHRKLSISPKLLATSHCVHLQSVMTTGRDRLSA